MEKINNFDNELEQERELSAKYRREVEERYPTVESITIHRTGLWSLAYGVSEYGLTIHRAGLWSF